MSLSRAMRFVSVFVLAAAVVLSAVWMEAAEAETPEGIITVNDGVPVKKGTIKLSGDGRCLILEDGRCLIVNLNDAEIINDVDGECGTPEVTIKVNDGVPVKNVNEQPPVENGEYIEVNDPDKATKGDVEAKG